MQPSGIQDNGGLEWDYHFTLSCFLCLLGSLVGITLSETVFGITWKQRLLVFYFQSRIVPYLCLLFFITRYSGQLARLN